MVRIKGDDIDLAVFSVYLPANYYKNITKFHAILGQITKKLGELPERTRPIICMDANGHVGRHRMGDLTYNTSERGERSGALGPCQPEIQDAPGKAL